MTYTLILFISIGAATDAESNALAVVNGFQKVEECEAAGRKAQSTFSRGTKRVEYVCVGK